MKRSDFLKTLGLSGVAAAISPVGALAKARKVSGNPTCVLIPSETAGPFPLDLSANTTYFRQDVRETKTGVPLNLKLKINGLNNCLPMPNLRVNIWHCDKDGLYSGYNQQNNQGQSGLTYLRGYQFTDSKGEVDFTTILPGWYGGRLCHIHFQVYVSTSYAAISQLTFDIPTKNAIYAANSALYTKGADPLTYANDMVFSDGHDYQLATLTPNATTGGYDSYLELSIQGNGTVGVGNLEYETAKQFVLGQNYPNPYNTETTIPFTLKQTGEVVIDLYDLQGRKVATVFNDSLGAGEHAVTIHTAALGLPTGNYAYQMEVRTVDGIFRNCKMMTSSRN